MIRKDMPRQNSILRKLDINEYQSISAYLERIETFFGEIIYEVEEESPYIYFPTSSVITLSELLEDDTSSEIAAIDKRSNVGVVGLINGKITPHMAMVTKTGITYRLEKRFLTPKLKSILGAHNSGIYRAKTTAVENSVAA